MSIIDLFKIKVDSIISFPLQPSESHSKDYCKKVIYILKDAICDNQILFAQYAYLASTRHQALKEEFNGLKRLEKLSEYRNELEGHLDSQLKEAFKINFKYIKDYFKLRLKSDESDVRVCVKLQEDPRTGQKEIVDFLRDKQMYTYSNCPIESNTGFEQVYKSGKYYLNNNIPDEVKQSRYKNPRLNEAKAIKYTHMLNRWEKFKIKKFKKPDEKWIDCWEEIRKPDGSTYRPNPEACYKSTIIIPMTLRENKYGNPEFFKRFRIQDDTERAIYGFLCIDHHQEDFFEQEPDQRIGYIFADIMSLYLITHLTYTRYSKTYPKVKQYLKK